MQFSNISMAALWNKAGHYIFVLWFLLSVFHLLSFLSSRILSHHRLDVYHTSTHGPCPVSKRLAKQKFSHWGFPVNSNEAEIFFA